MSGATLMAAVGDGGIVNLNGQTNNNAVSFARGFVFKANGTVEYYDDYADAGQIDNATDWIIPNSIAPGAYEVRCTVNSGQNDGPHASSTWLALTSDREFYDDTSGVCNYTIEIRLGAAVVASGTYICTTP